METFGERIKKSGQGLSDQGARFYTDTKAASRELMTFVHEEARGWRSYLLERYKHLEGQGREVLQHEGSQRTIWVHLDELLARVRGRDEDDGEDAVEPKSEAEAEAEASAGPGAADERDDDEDEGTPASANDDETVEA